MTTDTSEKGLEALIMRHMTGEDGLPAAADVVRERPAAYGGTGYVAGVARKFDRAHEIDLLREYRTRLVADVVTGKLDVRARQRRGCPMTLHPTPPRTTPTSATTPSPLTRMRSRERRSQHRVSRRFGARAAQAAARNRVGRVQG